MLKPLVLFLFLSVIGDPAKYKCPASGLDKNGNVPSARIVKFNTLKNRGNEPSTIDHSITLAKLLAPGNDSLRFDNSTAVTITAYLVGAKSGGQEDCNCFYAKDDFIDTHIEIASTPDETEKSNMMVVEMTPRFKAKHADWRTKEIKKLIGKKVKLTGWLFFDGMHKQNAKNTNPKGKKIWRATSWEIHPVTAFEVIQ